MIKTEPAPIGGLTNGVTVPMAGADSAFANHGVYTKPTAIVKVLSTAKAQLFMNIHQKLNKFYLTHCYFINRYVEDVITKGTGKAANTHKTGRRKTGYR